MRVTGDVGADGKRLVEVQVDGLLSPGEATMLSIQIQELTKDEGQRWSRSRKD